ncbi:mCG146181, partial [Mus musculus]
RMAAGKPAPPPIGRSRHPGWPITKLPDTQLLTLMELILSFATVPGSYSSCTSLMDIGNQEPGTPRSLRHYPFLLDRKFPLRPWSPATQPLAQYISWCWDLHLWGDPEAAAAIVLPTCFHSARAWSP